MPKYRDDDVAMLVGDIRREPGRFVFLTGPGMSFSGGVPSTSQLLDEIHQRFASELAHLSDDDRQDLNTCLRCLSLEERRSIIGMKFNGLVVNWSHIALACLMQARHVNRVLTVNTDNLLGRACALVGLYPDVYDVDKAGVLEFDQTSHPTLIHLRGQGHAARLTGCDDADDSFADHARTLLRQTLATSSLVVIGYDGQQDPLLPMLQDCFAGRRRLYWFSDREEPEAYLQPLLDGRHKALVRHFGGVDADEMMIRLAVALNCFPPDIIARPARHIYARLATIAPFPMEKTEFTIDILEGARAKLRGEPVSAQPVPLSGGTAGTTAKVHQVGKLPEISGNDNSGLPPTEMPATPDAAIPAETLATVTASSDTRQPRQAPALSADRAAPVKKPEDKQPVTPGTQKTDFDAGSKAWSHFVEGYNNSEMAERSNSEALLRKACEDYALAVRHKADFCEALNNWGICLRKLGEIRREEVFYTHAIHKYELALKYKPDFLQALNNMAIALSDLAKLRKDDALYALSIEKYEQAMSINADFYKSLNDWDSKLFLTWKLTEKDEYMRRADDIWTQALDLKQDDVFEAARDAAERGDLAAARYYLETCQTHGTLPTAAALQADPKFQSLRNQSWFITLLMHLAGKARREMRKA